MKSVLTRIALAVAMLTTTNTVSAQGIESEGANQVLLPSVQYSSTAWPAWIYNVNYGVFTSWGIELECQGVPPTDRRGREWYDPAYERTDGDFSWERHDAPFSNDAWYNGLPSYQWTGNNNVADIYVRRSFTLEGKLPTNVYLACGHDDGVSHFYINGTLVLMTNTGWNNAEYMKLNNAQKALLKTDGTENIIALHVHNNYGGAFADCGLYAIPDIEAGADPATSLLATEVTVANIDQTIDYSFNYGAWLELYNKAEENVNLGDLFISDDPEQMDKFCLPHTYGTIAPGKYGCIFFDHNKADGTYGPKADKQVPFKLNVEGGTLYLSTDGVTPFMQVSYPAAIMRCSWARRSLSSDEWGYNGTPTPRAANSSDFATERLAAPTVDTDSRLFTDAFTINVDIPEGTTLRYTTDGSTPTLQNGKTSRYGKFQVSNTTCYRFRLFQDGMLPSQVVTRSYIFRDEDYYLPVISITTESENLYGDSIGVYVDGVNGVDGRNHGKSNVNMDWERPVNFEYITPDGRMAINQEAEFCISGGWSRHYAPSSFKLKATKLYEGQNSFDFPFFARNPYKKYKQLLVRNGGNDNDSWSHGRVRDAITQEVLTSNGFNVDAQMYQPTHVFFNGEYKGMLNLREPNNKYNGTASYGYDDDEMDAFEYSNGYFQMAGTRDAFDRWLTLSQNAENEETYRQIRELVDVDEVANYFAAITYIGCTDWINNSNNSKGYRSLPDGKFHLTVLDQDWGWGSTSNVSTLCNANHNDLIRIFNGMRRNPEFRRMFINAYCILGGSVFTPERCEAIGDSICQLVEPALAMEGRQPWTSFGEQRNQMTGTNYRAARMQSLKNSFGLSNGMKAQFRANIPQASFMLDKQAVPGAAFNGTLYAPVTITASAPAGYIFEGWQGTGTTTDAKQVFASDSQWQYYDEGSLDDVDWYAPDCDFQGWKTGETPIGYSSRASITTETNKFNITYYFRKTFTLDEEPKADDVFTLDYGVDDGYVIYVNGEEAAPRYLMPEGDITYETLAITFAPDPVYEGSMTLSPSLFHKGENVIALQVHNNVSTSSDIYWRAALNHATTGSNLVSRDNQLVLEQNQDINLTAVFRRAYSETPVRINEVSASNDIYASEHFKRDDWMELYNTTDEEIDIAGMFLSDNIGKPEKYEIQAVDGISTVVPAHGTLLIWADKREQLSQLHAPFKLDNADGSVITLQAADGSWTDILQYNEHGSKETFGRYPDGGNATYTMSIPTIDRYNVLNSYDFELGELMKKDEVITNTFALEEGWNWTSHNLQEAVATEKYQQQSSILRSQTQELYHDGELGWVGSMPALRPAMGFKVKADSKHDVVLTGHAYDTNVPVSVSKGWNWIGCPLAKATVLTAALGNYVASEGDEVVGFNEFAVFSEGEWHGTLHTLNPGQAYMLKTNKTQAFRWNALTANNRTRRRYVRELEADDELWEINRNSYPDVMNVIAEVDAGDVSIQTNGCVVGAFVDGECRGVSSIEDGKLYLTIHGNAEENITFQIIDNELERYEARELVLFQPLDMKGSVSSPFVLHINSATDIVKPSIHSREISTEYYTLGGMKMQKPYSGVYLKKTLHEDGNIIVTKVMR